MKKIVIVSLLSFFVSVSAQAMTTPTPQADQEKTALDHIEFYVNLEQALRDLLQAYDDNTDTLDTLQSLKALNNALRFENNTHLATYCVLADLKNLIDAALEIGVYNSKTAEEKIGLRAPEPISSDMVLAAFNLDALVNTVCPGMDITNFIDTRLCANLLARKLNGETITRQEVSLAIYKEHIEQNFNYQPEQLPLFNLKKLLLSLHTILTTQTITPKETIITLCKALDLVKTNQYTDQLRPFVNLEYIQECIDNGIDSSQLTPEQALKIIKPNGTLLCSSLNPTIAANLMAAFPQATKEIKLKEALLFCAQNPASAVHTIAALPDAAALFYVINQLEFAKIALDIYAGKPLNECLSKARLEQAIKLRNVEKLLSLDQEELDILLDPTTPTDMQVSILDKLSSYTSPYALSGALGVAGGWLGAHALWSWGHAACHTCMEVVEPQSWLGSIGAVSATAGLLYGAYKLWHLIPTEPKVTTTTELAIHVAAAHTYNQTFGADTTAHEQQEQQKINAIQARARACQDFIKSLLEPDNPSPEALEYKRRLEDSIKNYEQFLACPLNLQLLLKETDFIAVLKLEDRTRLLRIIMQ